MNTLSKLINSVSFENALEKNSIHRVYENLNGTGKELILKSMKVYFLAGFSWFICLISGIKGAGFPIVASIVILGVFIGYVRSKHYFKKCSLYNSCLFDNTNNCPFFLFCLDTLEKPRYD